MAVTWRRRRRRVAAEEERVEAGLLAGSLSSGDAVMAVSVGWRKRQTAFVSLILKGCGADTIGPTMNPTSACRWRGQGIAEVVTCNWRHRTAAEDKRRGAELVSLVGRH